MTWSLEGYIGKHRGDESLAPCSFQNSEEGCRVILRTVLPEYKEEDWDVILVQMNIQEVEGADV